MRQGDNAGTGADHPWRAGQGGHTVQPDDGRVRVFAQARGPNPGAGRGDEGGPAIPAPNAENAPEPRFDGSCAILADTMPGPWTNAAGELIG